MKYDEIGTQINAAELTSFYYALGWQSEVSFRLSRTIDAALAQKLSNRYATLSTDTITLKSPANQSAVNLAWMTSQIGASIAQKLPEDVYLSALAQQPDSLKLTATLPEGLLKELFETKFYQTGIKFVDFRNQVYLKVAAQIVFARPWLTYCFGASMPKNNAPQRSFQSTISELGMQLAEKIDYTTLPRYAQSVALANDIDNVKLNVVDGNIVSLTITKLDYAWQAASGITLDLMLLINSLVAFSVMVEAPTAAQITQSRQQAATIALQNPFAKFPATLKTTWLNFGSAAAKFASAVGDVRATQLWQKNQALLDDALNTPAAKLQRTRQTVALDKFNAKLSQKQTQLLRVSDHNNLLGEQLANTITPLFPSEVGLVQAAIANDLPLAVTPLQKQNVITINAHQFVSGISQRNNFVAVQLAQDKCASKKMAASANANVLAGFVAKDVAAGKAIIAHHFKDSALVIKQASGTSHHPVVFRIPPTTSELMAALKANISAKNPALIEAIMPGSIYQVAFINGKIAGIVERIAARVVGDGRSDIATLVKKSNQKRNFNRQLQLNSASLQVLKQQGLTEKSVPARGIEVYLNFAATPNDAQQQLNVMGDIDKSYLPALTKIFAQIGLVDGTMDVIMPNIYQPYDGKHKELITFLSASAMIDWQTFDDCLLEAPKDMATTFLASFD